jgi:hypothetical protein
MSAKRHRAEEPERTAETPADLEDNLDKLCILFCFVATEHERVNVLVMAMILTLEIERNAVMTYPLGGAVDNLIKLARKRRDAWLGFIVFKTGKNGFVNFHKYARIAKMLSKLLNKYSDIAAEVRRFSCG